MTLPTPAAQSLDTAIAPHVRETIALLQHIARDFSPAKLAHSLGAEDVVLAHLIVQYTPTIGMFTLDTGRLNAETYELLDRFSLNGMAIQVMSPRHELVQAWTADHGMNGFYRSLEARKGCCAVRKVEPLGRALAGCRAWLTGQRRAQSITRRDLPLQEHDEAHALEKFNPLAAWSHNEVWAYIKEHRLTYNPLHDQGYASIGCAPCTRAITKGEDERAGRWWWEDAQTRECGLHLKKHP